MNPYFCVFIESKICHSIGMTTFLKNFLQKLKGERLKEWKHLQSEDKNLTFSRNISTTLYVGKHLFDANESKRRNAS